MATLTYRLVKGSELTYSELDGNFSTLNTAKLELGQAQASGVANALVYLNASKQPATSAALTFDGAGLFGVTSAGVSIVQSQGATQGVLRAVHSASGVTSDLQSTSAGGELRTVSNHPLLFSINLVEQMRLTSTGLGIGTSSPGQKLTVQGGLNVTSSATLPASQGSMLFSYESAVNRCYMGDGTGYSFSFSKRSASTTTDLMTLTDAGNLGINTTSPGVTLDVNGPTRVRSDIYIYGSGDRLNIFPQTAGSGVNVVSTNNANSAYSGLALDGSPLDFKVASGLQMRLTSTGLGIGTSAPASKLTVAGPVALQSPSSVNAATYTVQAADSALRFTTTNCTITLPAAASFPGRIIWLSNITANSVASASSNVVPLGSATAGTAILAATAGKFAVLQSDGTNWLTILAN